MYPLPKWDEFAACAAALRTRRGQPGGFPLLANQPLSLRTRFARKSKWRFGIAARPPQRVSKSGLLPRRGAHRAPAYQHPAGASPSCKRQAQTLHRQHPRPRGQAQNPAVATLSQIKFFHRMWINLFAVAGSRGHPPAGVIRKRGSRPPLVRLSRAATPFPTREARALSSVLSEEIPPGAQCAPLRLPHYGHFSMQISHFSYGNDLRNML